MEQPIEASNPSGDAIVSYPVWAASAHDLTVAHETRASGFYIPRGDQISPLSASEARSGISRVRLRAGPDRNGLLLSLTYPFRIVAAARDRCTETYAALVQELDIGGPDGESRVIGAYFALATDGAPHWISPKLPPSVWYARRILFDANAGVIVCSTADEWLLVYDVKRRLVREIRFDGWERADLGSGGIAWHGDETLLVCVLKDYIYGEQKAMMYTSEGPKETVSYLRTIIPKLYKVNLRTETWTYLGSVALLGASASGNYLAVSSRTGTTIQIVKPTTL